MRTYNKLWIVGVMLGATPALANSSVQVERVEVAGQGDSSELVLHTSAPPTFQSFSRRDPNVLIVDLVDAESLVSDVQSPGGAVRQVTLKNHRAKNGTSVARLTVQFSETVRYRVGAEKKQVRVKIFPGEQMMQKLAKAVPPQDRVSSDDPVMLAQEDEVGASTDDGSGGSGNKMTYIGFKNSGDKSRVFARMSEKGGEYEVKKEGDNLVVLEIKNARIPLRNNKNHLDATFFESPVKVITPSEVDDSPPYIRITIEMKENVPYEAKVEGREIAVYFQK